MASRTFLVFFIVFSSWVFLGSCQGGTNGSSTPCVQKLLPCQQYLKGSPAPTSECCMPLREIIRTETQCLCEVLNNGEIMKSLNVTQDDALKLAKTCGADVDTSICKKVPATPPGTSPATPSSPSTSPNGTSTKPSPPSKSGASLISHFGGLLPLAALFNVIFSTF